MAQCPYGAVMMDETNRRI